MAKKRSSDPPPTSGPPDVPAETSSPPSDTNGTAGNGPPAGKVVRKFSCPCGRDEHLHVEVVESEHPAKGATITVLAAVCSRTYAKGDGEVGTSYSYRVQHIPLLTHLLSLAHGFIVSQRVVEDVPF